MRLVDQRGEVFWNGIWTPICGHCFWDNDGGATAFCKKGGSESGKIIGRIPIPSNGIQIGICNGQDIANGNWPYCTGACNQMTVGGGYGCDAGQDNNGVMIECCKDLQYF